MTPIQTCHQRRRRPDGATAGCAGRRRPGICNRRRLIDRAGHPRLGAATPARSPVSATRRAAVAATLDAPVDVVIDFSSPAGALAISQVCIANEVPLVVATTGLEPAQQAKVEAAAANDSAALVAEHEPGRQPGDEAPGIAAGHEGSSQRRRRRDHRAASSLQGGCAQRHGPEVRRDHRPGMGQDRAARPPRAARASGRTAKSAITPSAPATTRASTRSSSACWAKPWKSPCAPATATAMPTAALAAAKFLAGKPRRPVWR